MLEGRRYKKLVKEHNGALSSEGELYYSFTSRYIAAGKDVQAQTIPPRFFDRKKLVTGYKTHTYEKNPQAAMSEDVRKHFMYMTNISREEAGKRVAALLKIDIDDHADAIKAKDPVLKILIDDYNATVIGPSTATYISVLEKRHEEWLQQALQFIERETEEAMQDIQTSYITAYKEYERMQEERESFVTAHQARQVATSDLTAGQAIMMRADGIGSDPDTDPDRNFSLLVDSRFPDTQVTRAREYEHDRIEKVAASFVSWMDNNPLLFDEELFEQDFELHDTEDALPAKRDLEQRLSPIEEAITADVAAKIAGWKQDVYSLLDTTVIAIAARQPETVAGILSTTDKDTFYCFAVVTSPHAEQQLITIAENIDTAPGLEDDALIERVMEEYEKEAASKVDGYIRSLTNYLLQDDLSHQITWDIDIIRDIDNPVAREIIERSRDVNAVFPTAILMLAEPFEELMKDGSSPHCLCNAILTATDGTEYLNDFFIPLNFWGESSDEGIHDLFMESGGEAWLTEIIAQYNLDPAQAYTINWNYQSHGNI